MAYDQVLTDRIRAALAGNRRVEEKKMFGGIAFMVQGKMCVTVGKERIMCRIDPEVHDVALQHKACRTVVMRGRQYRGFVYVDAEAVRTKASLDYWVGLALDYNEKNHVQSRRKSR